MTRKTFFNLLALSFIEKYLPKNNSKEDAKLNIKELDYDPIENLESGSFCYTDDYKNILYFKGGVCMGYREAR